MIQATSWRKHATIAFVCLGLASLQAADGPTTHPATQPSSVPRQTRPDPELARPKDIRVGLAVLPAVNRDRKGVAPTTGPADVERLFAYVIDISDHPIRLYKPGLVGPNIGGPKGQVLCAEFPTNLHPGGYGIGDFVILEPGDIWGSWSAYSSSYRGANCELSAYYIFRAPWAKDGDVPVYNSDTDPIDGAKR